MTVVQHTDNGDAPDMGQLKLHTASNFHVSQSSKDWKPTTALYINMEHLQSVLSC